MTPLHLLETHTPRGAQVDTSTYAIPRADATARWARATAAAPGFRFHFKAFGLFCSQGCQARSARACGRWGGWKEGRCCCWCHACRRCGVSAGVRALPPQPPPLTPPRSCRRCRPRRAPSSPRRTASSSSRAAVGGTCALLTCRRRRWTRAGACSTLRSSPSTRCHATPSLSLPRPPGSHTHPCPRSSHPPTHRPTRPRPHPGWAAGRGGLPVPSELHPQPRSARGEGAAGRGRPCLPPLRIPPLHCPRAQSPEAHPPPPPPRRSTCCSAGGGWTLAFPWPLSCAAERGSQVRPLPPLPLAAPA